MSSTEVLSPIALSGTVDIRVDGVEALPDWQQAALKAAMDTGMMAPQKLRFACAIARAANETFETLHVNDARFVLNPAAKAQFGRNAENKAYLTVGVIDTDNRERYRLHWEGPTAIPRQMVEVAVRHDEGQRVPTVVIPIRLEDANIWKLGEKSGRKQHDPRKNHDTGPDGEPYPRLPRRHHRRSCMKDLLEYDQSVK